jgi:signal transduction histidine kinase/phage shock protein PspC (stress-responsive transcriptional regulator)
MRRVLLPDHRPLPRLRFHRSATDRLVAGVAGGLARRLRADAYVVRLAFVVLGLAGGFGIVLYAVAWLLSEPPRPESDATAPGPALPERSVAVGLLTLGALVLLRAFHLWPGDAVMVPAIVLAGGSALFWHGSHASSAARHGDDPFDRLLSGRASPLRVAVGLVMAVAGLVTLVANGDLRSVPRSAAAVGLAVAGLALVLGPFAGRLMNELRSAERERIRTEERAEIAAQLHDSVLQTLALMQRAATDPRRMVLLARRQERELRHWLYGGRVSSPAQTLSGHAEQLAAEIELDHDLPVELVVVGDHAVDGAATALLGAVREAAVNAAKHAGAEEVAVYLEVNPEKLVAYVRDKGRGFSPDCVPADRHGIDDSIRSRVARVGGRARLDTAPGDGTEWELEVPV